MKTARKVLILALCAILLVSATIMGTMAYLTAQTEVVNNTFTVGNVSFASDALDEADVDEYGELLYKDDEKLTLADRVTANTYKLIPGHTYTKDPTVHMSTGTEDCWLFVKVDNGIADIEAGTTIAEQMAANGWVVIDAANGVWALDETAGASEDIVVFESFTLASDAQVDQYSDAEITIQALAIQADGFDTAEDAWNTAVGGSWPEA